MRKLLQILSFAGLILLAVGLVGCLVSGTFVIVEPFNFTAVSGYYHYSVDLTTQSAWEDHKDEIDFIDAVGFEFDIESHEAGSTVFNAWVAPSGSIYSSVAEISASATKVLNDLTIEPGVTHVSYDESLKHLTNVAALKALVKSGKFEYYGTSSNPSYTFDVVNGKVIVTFSASGS